MYNICVCMHTLLYPCRDQCKWKLWLRRGGAKSRPLKAIAQHPNHTSQGQRTAYESEVFANQLLSTIPALFNTPKLFG